MKRWPLYLIALPAAVAVWSGWVGLGALCGFGVIHPLPGIWDAATLNTAITLPVGVESYGAYALGAWLTPGTPERARKFARRSAIGSLVLGMGGQVIYHLLSAAHATRAPWPVVALVSCLPVVVLGFGAALTHLLRDEVTAPVTAPQDEPVALPDPAPVPIPVSVPMAPPTGAPAPVPVRSARTTPRRTRSKSPETVFAADLAAGKVPSLRRIRTELKVGQVKAQEVQGTLRASLKAA